MPDPSSPPTVCVPYVKGMLRSETHGRVFRSWPTARFVELPAKSPTAYAKLLVRLWAEPGDLVVVEQDVVPPAGSIKKLLRCRSLWCTHAYEGRYCDLDDMLGLARFSAALKTAYPFGMEAALFGGGGSHNWPHWRSCDHRLAKWLRAQALTPHRHRPDAVHLHDWPADTVTQWMWPMLTPDSLNPHAPLPRHDEAPAGPSPGGGSSDGRFSVDPVGGLDAGDDH